MFPVRIQENEAVLQAKKAGMEAAEGILKQLQVDRKEKENDLASREEKIKKHEGELAAIKTNKEYKAMLEQIDSLRADVSLLEEKIIEVLDKAEEAKRVFDEEKKLFEEEKKKSDQEKNTIQAEQKKVEARLGELAGDRTKLKEPVDKGILAKYEQVLMNRGKTAIARIDGEFCGECNMKLRPQVINEARLKENVVICESCQRILYSE